MENGDPTPYLFDFMSISRLVTASFLPILRFVHLLTRVSSVFSELVPPLKHQMSCSDYSRSCCIYNIYLGLHPYVQHGARSGLEIEVDFHEGAVHFSTVPAIYRDRWYSPLSILFAPYLLTLNIFVLDQTGGGLTKTVCWNLSFSGGGSYLSSMHPWKQKGIYLSISNVGPWTCCIWG